MSALRLTLRRDCRDGRPDFGSNSLVCPSRQSVSPALAMPYGIDSSRRIERVLAVHLQSQPFYGPHPGSRNQASDNILDVLRFANASRASLRSTDRRRPVASGPALHEKAIDSVDGAANERGYACEVEFSDQQFQVYNEAAFQYFLEIEQKRAGRSKRRFLLLLVDLKEHGGSGASFGPASSGKLFSSLKSCVRETDFIGWYRQEAVAGAVLTQLTDTVWTDAARLVVQRVDTALKGSLSPSFVRRLHVRVFQLPSNSKSWR